MRLGEGEAQEVGASGGAGVVGGHGMEAEGFVEGAGGGHGGEGVEVDGAVAGGASGVDGCFGEEAAEIVASGAGTNVEAFEFSDVDGVWAKGDATEEFGAFAGEEEGAKRLGIGPGKILNFRLEVLVVEVDGQGGGVFLDEFASGGDFFGSARADNLDVQSSGCFHGPDRSQFARAGPRSKVQIGGA